MRTAPACTSPIAVASAKAQVRSAELNLGYTTIRSPLTGKAGDSAQREGSLVTPGSSGLLTTLVQTDPMWIVFGLGEQDDVRVVAPFVGGGFGSGASGALIAADRFVSVGQSIPTSLKVTFGDNETKAFFGVTKGGGIALQPLLLPQIASNVIPVSWRQGW